jgi:hypothetical protein
MLPLICALVLCAPQKFDFYAHAPYDSRVPRPEAILGYAAGDRHTTFRDQERVLLAIADAAKDRVRVVQYGKSCEGRPLRIFIVGAKSNISRLDNLQKQWRALAEAAAAPEKGLPALVWINECIHGNEPASFESAMWLLYNLAAGKVPALDNTVVVINPVYNPDGHERFAVWYNSIATGSSSPDAFEGREPSIIHGRENHYRFDMNRDRVAMSQDETRQEVAEFLKWNPQVYVDQHGEVGGYFFPPNPMSINAAVDRKRLNRWTGIFGRSNAAAFDAHGWQYYIEGQFDFFFAGYLDTWAALHGAIGMTYETESGKRLNEEREDGSILTFETGIAKHFVTAIATISAASENREELLRSFFDFKRKAANAEFAGKFKRVVVSSPDYRPLMRLSALLARSGIESYFSAGPFSQGDAHSYWQPGRGEVKFPSGSLVIDIAQARGPAAKAMLEPSAEFEPEFIKQQLDKIKAAPPEEEYPGREGPDFYDTTAWSLPYAHNLQAWWCESAQPISRTDSISAPSHSIKDSKIGWALPYSDRQDILAIFDLLDQGARCMVATKRISSGDQTFEPGTFLVLRSRNEPGIETKLDAVAKSRQVRFVSLATGYPGSGGEGIGSESVVVIRKPNIAVVFGESVTAFGAWWWYLEREWKLPFTPITANALNGDLSKYSTVVCPPGRYAAGDKLKDWVRAGGCLVVCESLGWALGERGFAKLEEVKKEKGEPKSLPGTLFRAKLEPRIFLSYGYASPELAVPIEGGTFYKARKEGGGAVTFSEDEKDIKWLSGWIWPDDSEKNLKGTVWLHDEPFGKGHVVIFTQSPVSRAMWPGLEKLALNSLLLGAH